MFIQTRNKKGVSIMIGYVLLITFAVVIAAVVFQGLKTYVPQEGIDCPDGVSVYISKYDFNNVSNELNLTIKNNGKFSIGGIFIYYSENADAEIATKDMSLLVPSDRRLNPGVRLEGAGLNSLEPNKEQIVSFNVTGIDHIYAIEMIPLRWQEEGTKKPFPVSCVNAKTKKIVDEDTDGL